MSSMNPAASMRLATPKPTDASVSSARVRCRVRLRTAIESSMREA